jgi:hypothetical protein
LLRLFGLLFRRGFGLGWLWFGERDRSYRLAFRAFAVARQSCTQSQEQQQDQRFKRERDGKRSPAPAPIAGAAEKPGGLINP